jgi:hypothetical protein
VVAYQRQALDVKYFHGPMSDVPSTSRYARIGYPSAPFLGRQASIIQLGVRPTFGARAAWLHACVGDHRAESLTMHWCSAIRLPSSAIPRGEPSEGHSTDAAASF